MFEIECLTESSNDCASCTNVCSPECWPEIRPCGPDYGVDCMPKCDPADDEG